MLQHCLGRVRVREQVVKNPLQGDEEAMGSGATRERTPLAPDHAPLPHGTSFTKHKGKEKIYQKFQDGDHRA